MTASSTTKKLSLWLVSREYAGIAEAGGVKNVSCSLSEGLVRQGHDVTLFIPLYGCTMLGEVCNFTAETKIFTKVTVAGTDYKVAYAHASLKGVKIVFVIHPIFAQKKAVYVYTEADERENPNHCRSHGHKDAGIMNMLFQKAVLYFALKSGIYPDIVHCQDATTAMIPVFAHEDKKCAGKFSSVSFVVTIHNAGPGYHHAFDCMAEAVHFTGLPEKVLKNGLCGIRVEPFVLAGAYSVLTTVSPWYADEILQVDNPDTDGLSRAFVEHNYTIKGITNGIDYERYNPTDTSKSLLALPFNPLQGDLFGKYEMRKQFMEFFTTVHTNDISFRKVTENEISQFGTITEESDSVIYVYHGRIVHQKGLSVFASAASLLLSKCPWARILIIGQGDGTIEKSQIELSEKFPGRFIFFRGYERSFTRLCAAISDFLVLPSFFEPCGLEDFIGQIFGTIPVAHATGGLNKIVNGETGFLYKDNTPEVLANLLERLGKMKLEKDGILLKCITIGASKVVNEYSWNAVIENHYLPLYLSLINEKQKKRKK